MEELIEQINRLSEESVENDILMKKLENENSELTKQVKSLEVNNNDKALEIEKMKNHHERRDQEKSDGESGKKSAKPDDVE